MNKLVLQLVVIMFGATALGVDAKTSFDPKNLFGKFWITFYYVVDAADYPKTHDVKIRDVLGGTIDTVNKKFRSDMDIEGTGWLRDGRTVNFAKKDEGEIRYRVVTSKYGEGIGRCKLSPFHTMAVDPGVIPFGTKIFVPEFAGKETILPDGTKIKGKKIKLPDGTEHDGVFYAYDKGGMINDFHVDLFMRVGKSSSKPFEDQGWTTRSEIHLYKMADPDPNGCQSKDPDLTGSKLQAVGVASHLEALSQLIEEYTDRKEARALHYLNQKIEVVRGELEELENQHIHAASDISGRPDYVGVWKELEKEMIEERLKQKAPLVPSLKDFFPLGSRSKFSLQSMDLSASANRSPPSSFEFDPLAVAARPLSVVEFNGDELLNDGEVILTFDDGPYPRLTESIVATLLSNEVPATFFEVGEMVASRPKLTQLVVHSGFSIGNHSYTHPNLRKLDETQILGQVSRTNRQILKAMGGPDAFYSNYYLPLFQSFFNTYRKVWAPEFIRAPGGAHNQKVMNAFGRFKVGEESSLDSRQADYKPVAFTHVMWNIDSRDWSDKDPASIQKRVFRQLSVSKHGIVLMHDIQPQTAVAIQSIIPRLKREGYKVISMYELMKRYRKQEQKDAPAFRLSEL